MNTSVSPYPPIDVRVLERAARVIRVLGHPLRLRLLELLEEGERNVTELVLAAGVGQAAVSQQLRILRSEGVVGDRRDGPRVFYRITEPKVSKILACIRECDIPDLAGPSGTEVQDAVASILASAGGRGANGVAAEPSGAR
ncbi:MAG: ArsR/SmtB family transcription factor [Candidatus Limnocylindrales bacterium]